MHIPKWKKPIPQDYILYDFNYTAFGKKKKAKLWRQEKDQKLPGEGVGGDQSGEHREF